MAQYNIFSLGGTQAIELTDGASTFRIRLGTNTLHIEEEILPGVWGGIEEYTIPGESVPSFRIGADNPYWEVDGLQSGIVWTNIEQHQLP